VRTLEQLRAAHALGRVNELVDKPDELKKRYRAYVERLGPAIVMSGLGQALATERAAAGAKPSDDDQRAHAALYYNVQAWLCRSKDGVYPGADDLLEAIVGHDEPEYLRAQAEALAWLQWHKKFCRATLPRSEREE
jgi:CRISPR-associated protein Cmr5